MQLLASFLQHTRRGVREKVDVEKGKPAKGINPRLGVDVVDVSDETGADNVCKNDSGTVNQYRPCNNEFHAHYELILALTMVMNTYSI